MNVRLVIAGAAALGLLLTVGAVPSTGLPAQRAPLGHWLGETDRIEVPVADAGGDEVGRVVLRVAEPGIEVVARVSGLEPGYKGFHIHETPACDAGDPAGAFQSAGGHYAPGGGDHPEHAGDLPPLLVLADGTAALTTVTDRFTLDELAGSGAAVVVHADPDGGDRIACGVIQATGDLG